MQAFPHLKVAPFEEVAAGELFIFQDGDIASVAIKAKPRADGEHQLVLLGPEFRYDPAEAILLCFKPGSVLSFGKEFSVLLPTDAAAWKPERRGRDPVWLAVCGDTTYVCANGGGPQQFTPAYVDIQTGAVRRGQLPGAAMYTNSWEIVFLSATHLPRSIIKFPLSTSP